jgi:hypothetical protein
MVSAVSKAMDWVIYYDNYTVTDNNNITHNHMRLASFLVQPGDSGGPVFYGHTAKGLIHGVMNVVMCGSLHCGVYSHIWEVDNSLGVTVATS